METRSRGWASTHVLSLQQRRHVTLLLAEGKLRSTRPTQAAEESMCVQVCMGLKPLVSNSIKTYQDTYLTLAPAEPESHRLVLASFHREQFGVSFEGSLSVCQREDNPSGSTDVLLSLTCSQDKTRPLSRHNEQLFILSFANDDGSHTEGYFKNYLGLLYSYACI